jgi:peptide/nickel transport system substrate-binding protein
MLFGTMNPNLGKMAARIAGLLVLAAILGAGVQAAVAEENEMTIAIGDGAGIGTDPTLYKKIWPDMGGVQYHHLYTRWEPLITLDSSGDIIPWMAESYEVSDGYDTITFHLREGVAFADGKSFNASVTKFLFDRVWTYGLVDAFGQNGYLKVPLFIYYDHSEVVDEYTLKIYFTQGWLDMPRDIASTSWYGYFIHPEDVDPAWDIEGMLKPEKRFNGLGPYYVDENESVPDQEIVLKRRHSWRDDYDFHKPMLDKIVLKLIKDPQVAVMALEKGDVDYICRYWNVPLDSLPAMEDDSTITIETAPETQMYYLQTAYWEEPFSGEDGIRLRKAICYALDRDELVEGAFNGYAMPATDSMLLSPLRSDSPECCHKGYDYDLEEAKELLAGAGWSDTDGDGVLDKNGKSLKDLNLVISSASELGWQEDLALVVQSQLKRIGIDVQIQMVEPGVYNDLMNTGDFDLKMSYSMGGKYSTVDEFLSFGNSISSASREYYSNQNETLSTFIDAAKMADSTEEREEYLCQACDILYDDAGIIPLVYSMQYAIMNDKVTGFQFGISSTAYSKDDHVEECWIE